MPDDLLRRAITHPSRSEHAPLVVDIRSPHAFRRRHIPGSHNIPFARLISAEPPQRDLILVGTDGRDSARARDTLHQQGLHRRIEHLEGGVMAWLACGLPVETERGEADRTWPIQALSRFIHGLLPAFGAWLRPQRLSDPTCSGPLG